MNIFCLSYPHLDILLITTQPTVTLPPKSSLPSLFISFKIIVIIYFGFKI